MSDYQTKALMVLLALQFFAFLGVVLTKNPTKSKPWTLVSLGCCVLILGVTLL